MGGNVQSHNAMQYWYMQNEKKMGGSDDEGVITKYNRYGKSKKLKRIELSRVGRVPQ